MQHQAFRINKLSQKQTSTTPFEAPEKFWKAKNKVASKKDRKNFLTVKSKKHNTQGRLFFFFFVLIKKIEF